MSWFIFSEVMFFAVFFGTLFYARELSVPWLAGEGDNFLTNMLLWPGFENAWPSDGSDAARMSSAMAPWGIPMLNTALLLSSRRHDHDRAPRSARGQPRSAALSGSPATFVLGFVFLASRRTSTSTPTRSSG